MRAQSKLSIIVPVFNEAHAIRANLESLLGEVERYFARFEIIVVSDGSTDETNLRLLSFSRPGVRPLILDKNSGKGAAVRAGFQAATGDYILFIDGGMEIHPREIRIFMGLRDLYDCDIVIGSKRHPQSSVEYPWYRKFLSAVFQQLIRRLFDVNVTDTQVGIKLFRAEVIRAILPDLAIDRYGFDLELLCLARRQGFGTVLEAPITMEYFGKNHKSWPREIAHVAHVGMYLLRDTFRLHARLKRLPKRAKTKNALERAS